MASHCAGPSVIKTVASNQHTQPQLLEDKVIIACPDISKSHPKQELPSPQLPATG